MRLKQIAESLDQFMPPPSCKFQFGDCGLEVYSITRRAIAKGITDFTVIEGMVEVNGKIWPHYWIERNGQIIDPTKAQFNPEEPQYNPEGEYRTEYSPEEFVQDWIRQYGETDGDYLE